MSPCNDIGDYRTYRANIISLNPLPGVLFKLGDSDPDLCKVSENFTTMKTKTKL